IAGRPLLYETTQFFMEHFGLKNLDDLPNASELRKIPLPKAEPPAEAPQETPAEAAPEPASEVAPEPAPAENLQPEN
ncbi:MAG: SMC-Scp complex subunit ScpB, partial [Spartobacteria bacterium]